MHLGQWTNCEAKAWAAVSTLPEWVRTRTRARGGTAAVGGVGGREGRKEGDAPGIFQAQEEAGAVWGHGLSLSHTLRVWCWDGRI
jgi:hypothetical protein